MYFALPLALADQRGVISSCVDLAAIICVERVDVRLSGYLSSSSLLVQKRLVGIAIRRYCILRAIERTEVGIC
jgi:hypothetical protein